MNKLTLIILLLSIVTLFNCTDKSEKEKQKTTVFSTPSDFGVTNKQYRIAESNYYFKKSLAKAPINKWAHQDAISVVKTQQIIRENQDILYSSAVVDVSKGATFAVPKYDAYCIIQVIDMQNYSIATIYAGESKTITLKDVSYGNHVYLNARTQPTSYDKKGIENAHKQQRKLLIQANSSIAYQTPENLISDEKMLKVRTALIKDVAKGQVKDYSTLMGTKDFVNEQGHLHATAYGWGGLPIFDAGYLVLPNKASGRYCASITIDVPPLNKTQNGFWSVTTYNKKGWLARDKAAISDKNTILN